MNAIGIHPAAFFKARTRYTNHSGGRLPKSKPMVASLVDFLSTQTAVMFELVYNSNCLCMFVSLVCLNLGTSQANMDTVD